MSAFITAKALRLLITGRVIVYCIENGIEARVRGDHGEYRLWPEPWGWRRSCPARIRSCSHVVAVSKVAQP